MARPKAPAKPRPQRRAASVNEVRTRRTRTPRTRNKRWLLLDGVAVEWESETSIEALSWLCN